MMARKNTIKTDNPGSIHFDPRTKSVMAETSHLQDNIKEKVNAVREIMPGRSNNEIILVLQYYDYNVEKAIQAYVEDGAKQALTEWHYPGNKAPKKKRNKKKKPADNALQVNGDVASPEMVPNGIVPNGSIESDTEPSKTNSVSDISSSVSSLSLSPTNCMVPNLTSNIHTVSSTSDQSKSSIGKQTDQSQGSIGKQRIVDNSEFVHTEAQPQRAPPSHKKSHSPAVTGAGSATSGSKSQSPATEGKLSQSVTYSNKQTDVGEQSLPVKSSSQLPVNGTAQSDNSQKQSQPTVSGTTNHRPNSHQQHAKQQHHSGSHSHRQRTVSERSNDGHHLPKQIHKTLEKSVKDLHRQTVSLERLRLILNEEVDKNYKRIKSIFDEMRTCLNDREVELIREMDQVKVVANDTFHMRQNNAVELKLSIDRAERMDDKQLAQLRADIKHFVSERKVDEDLSRTTRFLYDSDHLKNEIKQFGEVVPVKCTYSQSRPSVSSQASNEDHVVKRSISEPVSTSVAQDTQQHGLDSKETEELAELQLRLKNSLHVQGYDKSELKSSSQPSREYRRRPDQRPSSGQRPTSTGGPRPQSGRGYGYRGRGGGGYRGRGQGRPRGPRKDYQQDTRGNNSSANIKGDHST